MTKELIISAIALIIAIVGVFTPFGGMVSDQLGNGTESFWDTAEGYKVDGTTVISGTGAGTFTSSVNIPHTSNTATSTLTVGCIQTYPTSTATAVRFDFFGNASTSVNGQTAVFPVGWRFGTCP